MAINDAYPFIAFAHQAYDSNGIDFGATPNTIKCALIKSAANGGHDPDPSDAYPTWGVAGSTDLSASEVTAGGNYSAGGSACANATSTVAGDVLSIDYDNPAAWEANGTNPTNARWAIFYDDTAADKPCLGYYDLGSDVDMSTDKLTVVVGTPAMTITVNPTP